MLFWRTLQCEINIDAISGRYCIDIGNIIGSIYFSNIKPILQKTIFAECWVWISSQYWDCILAQYLVNNFAIGSIIFQGTPQYQVNIDPITTWYCLDIGIIIGSIYFSNIKPILQKTIFAECWVWISSQYWDCIFAQYLVNKFCYLGGGADDTGGKSRRDSFGPIRVMAGPGPGRCQETPGGAGGPPENQEGGMEESLRGTEEQHPWPSGPGA